MSIPTIDLYKYVRECLKFPQEERIETDAEYVLSLIDSQDQERQKTAELSKTVLEEAGEINQSVGSDIGNFIMYDKYVQKVDEDTKSALFHSWIQRSKETGDPEYERLLLRSIVFGKPYQPKHPLHYTSIGVMKTYYRQRQAYIDHREEMIRTGKLRREECSTL